MRFQETHQRATPQLEQAEGHRNSGDSSEKKQCETLYLLRLPVLFVSHHADKSNVFVPSYRMLSGAKELVPKGYKRLDAAAEAATHLLERHIGLMGAGRMISFRLVSICCMKITLILLRNRYPWSIFIQSCLSLQLKYLIIVAIQSYNVYHNMCATSMIKLIQKNHDQYKQMIPWRI